MATAFPRCTAIESLWRTRLLPRALKMTMRLGKSPLKSPSPQAERDSWAPGESTSVTSPLHKRPHSLLQWSGGHRKKVSGQVASQTSRRPDRQGARVILSGLLPSDCGRPGGSYLEGTPAAERERCKMLLRVERLICWPPLYLKLRLCKPHADSSAPQCWRMCGAQMEVPRRTPTAILNQLSSILNPTDETPQSLHYHQEWLST